jgi:hypothetical protein
MGLSVIRFRCPRCQKLNAAALSKAGKTVVCPSCFGPLRVPERSVIRRSEIPTADVVTIDLIPDEADRVEVEKEPLAVEPSSVPLISQDWSDVEAAIEAATIAPVDPVEVEYDPEAEVGEPSQPFRRGPAIGVGAGVGLLAILGLVIGLTRLHVPTRHGNRLTVVEPAASATVADQGARAVSRADRPIEAVEPRPAARDTPATAAEAVPAPTPERLPAPAPAPEPTPIAETRPVEAQRPALPAPAPSEGDGPPPSPMPPVAAMTPPTPPADLPEPKPLAEAGKPIVVRRRQKRDQEELRRELESVPELVLNGATAELLLAQRGVTFAPIPVQYLSTPNGRVPVPPSNPAQADPSNRVRILPTLQPMGSQASRALLGQLQPELALLPWRLGSECHLAREPAEKLQTLSRALRDLLAEATPAGDTQPDPEVLRQRLLEEPSEPGRADPRLLAVGRRRRPAAAPEHWVDAAAIPALQQLLMADRTATREVLVDVLRKIPGSSAARALARLAVFDLAPEVRDRAILALRDRPAEGYQSSLLEGLRYPWPPAADHAAEALVALEDRAAIPYLIELLDRSDPQGTMTVPLYGEPVAVVPTVIKVNHLKNCLLCHDVSSSRTTDLVRGRVPFTGYPVPSGRTYYADSQPGLYVRAELTYLRQDFSVTQPVEGADPWPTQQRYDYLVYARPVMATPATVPTAHRPHKPKKPHLKTETDPAPTPSYPQRESVLFALRGLTGKDLGTSSRPWREAAHALVEGTTSR